MERGLRIPTNLNFFRNAFPTEVVTGTDADIWVSERKLPVLGHNPELEEIVATFVPRNLADLGTAAVHQLYSALCFLGLYRTESGDIREMVGMRPAADSRYLANAVQEFRRICPSIGMGGFLPDPSPAGSIDRGTLLALDIVAGRRGFPLDLVYDTEGRFVRATMFGSGYAYIEGANDTLERITTINDFNMLTAAAYGEASFDGPVEEFAAIVHVIRNRATYLNTTIEDIIMTTGVYGYKDEKNKEKVAAVMNGTTSNEVHRDILRARAGVIKSFTGPDLSHGAYYWDGADIARPGQANRKMGLVYSDPLHDIHETGDIRYPTPIRRNWTYADGRPPRFRGEYDHKLVSTVAIGETIFWKHSQDYKAADGDVEYRRP